MNSAVVQERPGALSPPRSVLPAILFFTCLGWLWFVLCHDLSLEWSANEQYSYGWFVPLFAAFLFWLRMDDAPTPHRAVASEASPLGPAHNPEPITIKRIAIWPCLIAFCLLLPLRLFEVSNADWRPLSWLHALGVVCLTLLAIYYVSGPAAVRHFAFPVCFILVAVPWLTPIETPIIQGLMKLVAAVATETFNLFGIPAQLEGNLVRVSSGVVGVSQACSGVRSLQTSLMIGLLFGELKRLTIDRRIILVLAALVISLLANFGRAICLVAIASSQGLAAVERWHDLAGYAIVGFVVLGTLAIARSLGKRKSSRLSINPSISKLAVASTSPLLNFSTLPLSLTLAYLILVELGVSSWYRWHERYLVPTANWSVQWPVSAPGYREMRIDDHTREMLRFNRGREASWLIPTLVRHNDPGPLDSQPAARAILYFFRWEPGAATALRARAHRPDICLPAAGWRQTSNPAPHSYPVNEKLSLLFQQFSFVHEEPGQPPLYAETFFCLHEDRISAGQSDNQQIPFSNWSVPERWETVRRGFRNPGQQVLQCILLSRHLLGEAELQEMFSKLVPRLVKAGH